MDDQKVELNYEAWCHVHGVCDHYAGRCLKCIPVGFPRPAFVPKDVKPAAGRRKIA